MNPFETKSKVTKSKSKYPNPFESSESTLTQKIGGFIRQRQKGINPFERNDQQENTKIDHSNQDNTPLKNATQEGQKNSFFGFNARRDESKGAERDASCSSSGTEGKKTFESSRSTNTTAQKEVSSKQAPPLRSLTPSDNKMLLKVAESLENLKSGKIPPDQFNPSRLLEDLLSVQLRGADADKAPLGRPTVRQSNKAGGYGSGAPPVPILDLGSVQSALHTTMVQLNAMDSYVSTHLEELMAGSQEVHEHQEVLVQQGLVELRHLYAGAEKLENKFNQASMSAVRTGDKLSVLHTQKERAAKALDLLGHFQAFKYLQCDTIKGREIPRFEDLPPIFHDKSTPENEERAAKLLLQLRSLSEELTESEENRIAANNIQLFAEEEERRLLNQFKGAISSKNIDIKSLKDIVQTLTHFNDDSKIYQRYIEYVVDDVNGNYNLANSGESLLELFQGFMQLCERELPIIKQIFPGRMAQRLIRQLIPTVLYSQIQSQAENLLQQHDLSTTTSLAEYLDDLITAEVKKRAVFQVILENCQDWETEQVESMKTFMENLKLNLFKDHKQQYASNESRLVTLRITEDFHNSLECSYGLLTAEVHKELPIAKIGSVQECNLLAILSFLKEGKVFKKVVGSASESIVRCNVMLEQERCAYAVTDLYTTLCQCFAKCVLEPVLTIASNVVRNSEKADDPQLMLMYEIIEKVHEGMILLQQFFREQVVEGMQEQPTAKTIVMEKHRRVMQTSEKCAIDALKVAFQSILLSIEKELNSSSYRAAYNLSDEQADFKASDCFQRIAKLLRLHNSSATSHLPDLDLSMMWSSLAVKIYESFSNHLRKDKKMQITSNGALILHQDIDTLKNAMLKFQNKQVIDELNKLKAISQLYIVPVENLREVIQQEPIVRIPIQEIHEYVKRRADYKGKKWPKDLFSTSETSTN